MQTTTLTPEQVELRKGRITSTRIVKLVQGQALAVWNDMMGIAPPFVDSARPRWGRRLERAIIEGAAEERGWGQEGSGTCLVYQPGTIIASFDARLATSPDAIVEEEGRVIEAKNRGAERAREYDDEPLESEIVQTQWHMGVTGHDKATICVLLGGNDLRLFDREHDDELWAGLVEIADRFLVDYVKPRRAPPLDASDAAADYLRATFPTHRGPMVEAPDALDLARSYRAACAAVDDAEAAKKEVGNLLRQRIGGAEGICGPGFKATWKASKAAKVTDWEALAKSYAPTPGILAQFTTERPGSRRLLVTVKEG